MDHGPEQGVLTPPAQVLQRAGVQDAAEVVEEAAEVGALLLRDLELVAPELDPQRPALLLQLVEELGVETGLELVAVQLGQADGLAELGDLLLGAGLGLEGPGEQGDRGLREDPREDQVEEEDDLRLEGQLRGGGGDVGGHGISQGRPQCGVSVGCRSAIRQFNYQIAR